MIVIIFRRYQRLKIATVIIQKYWKGWAQRRRYQRMKVGYMRLQALIRSRVLSHRFRHLRGHIVGLQARARGYLIRRMYTRKLAAILKIQSHVRRIIAQRKFHKIQVNFNFLRDTYAILLRTKFIIYYLAQRLTAIIINHLFLYFIYSRSVR